MFKIDENSILTVTATDKGTSKKETITITNEKGRLTKEEIEQMIKDSEKYAEEDKRTKERLDAEEEEEEEEEDKKKIRRRRRRRRRRARPPQRSRRDVQRLFWGPSPHEASGGT